MGGRPEGTGGGNDDIRADPAALDGFTPWLPGDKPATTPPAPNRGNDAASRYRWSPSPGETGTSGRTERHKPDSTGGGFEWTEPQREQFYDGDRVRSTRAVGGVLGGAVPPGTIGYVESTRMGALGDTYHTVRFDNGYTEEIRADDISREGWFG